MDRITGDPGVPLAHYRQHEGCGVAFHCPCGKSKRMELEEVISFVGEATGIREVARIAKKPCECGRLEWETRPDFKRPKPWASDER